VVSAAALWSCFQDWKWAVVMWLIDAYDNEWMLMPQ
jgi:hypothetical protein